MDRDSFLGLVRVLTEQVIAAACPEKLADFADDFGDFTLQAGALQVCDRLAYQPPPGSGLDTTLVAGMFFEVLLDAARLPAGRRERVSFVRKRAKDYLVNRLAGQITLSQFYRLLNLIEEQVGHYFEHLTDDWIAPPRDREAAAPSPEPEAIDGEALRRALSRLSLPLEGKRKLTFETLWDFLRGSGGGWFRLLDFEAHFRINKKTAWGYLNLLQKEGVLEHNGEKANRVRYAVAPAFRAEPEKMLPS
ncbi:MAG: hypothetical protein ACLQED_02515 [Desulfobaccales bacterium]